MAQPDSCPDVSNGAIVHSPVIICSELDNQRERENDDREEEDDEVELAEEVGEDVLMMVGVEESQVEEENREMKEAEKVQTIQVVPLPNGVLSEESVAGEIQEESNENVLAVEHKECGLPDEQKTDDLVKESTTEEMSHETDSVLKNHCHLSSVLQVKKDGDTHLENDKEIKEKKDDEEKDEESHLQNNNRIKEKDEEEKNGETYARNNEEIKEQEDKETHLENNDEVKEMEEECNNQDVIMGPETELKADNSKGIDNGFEKHKLSNTNVDRCQDLHSHEQESKETVKLSSDDNKKTENIVIDDKITDRSEEVPGNSVLDTTEEDQNIHQDNDGDDSLSVILTDVADTIEMLPNQTEQRTNDHESEIKNTYENNQSSQQEAESVIEESCPQDDYVEAEVEVKGGEEFPQEAVSEPEEVQEMESEADQRVDQPEVGFVTTEEQSATMEGIKEEQMELFEDITEEDKVQVCDIVPTVMDAIEQSIGEGGEIGEYSVRKSVCEDEYEKTDDKEIPENDFAPTEDKAIPEPELQCLDDVSSETEQGIELIQAKEAVKMEEENPPESEKLEAYSKLEENETPTQEVSDVQEHPTQSFEETAKDTEGNSREQGLPEERMEGGAATDTLVEEPVTVLDDEFDEIEETPTTELDDPTPELTAPCDNPEEELAVEHQELQLANKPDGKNYEMQQDGGEVGEGTKAKEEDDREILLELNDRVKGLKEALENGTLGVELQPSNKEDHRQVRVSSSKRKDDDWIKKNEPEAEKTTEAKEWKKEPKPVKKNFWESERTQKEIPPPDEKGPQRRDDWITELKSVIRDESLPKRKDEQVKKKRVVLFEDGRSYFPHREETTEKREEVTLISHKKVDGPPVSPVPPVQSHDKVPHDQVYEISLYVKVINN